MFVQNNTFSYEQNGCCLKIHLLHQIQEVKGPARMRCGFVLMSSKGCKPCNHNSNSLRSLNIPSPSVSLNRTCGTSVFSERLCSVTNAFCIYCVSQRGEFFAFRLMILTFYPGYSAPNFLSVQLFVSVLVEPCRYRISSLKAKEVVFFMLISDAKPPTSMVKGRQKNEFFFSN
ncbi:hypothetical protein Mapa_016022 [Marchantia paleacea]|nr:hypothetical protein Mapa_016022 [Marchantia paleacea]